MENSTDPDQMASSEASCSGSTVFFKICIIVGSTGPGLFYERKRLKPLKMIIINILVFCMRNSQHYISFGCLKNKKKIVGTIFN